VEEVVLEGKRAVPVVAATETVILAVEVRWVRWMEAMAEVLAALMGVTVLRLLAVAVELPVVEAVWKVLMALKELKELPTRTSERLAVEVVSCRPAMVAAL
jgi:hypothetical protein